ncbi:MAG: sugar phosphate isomerase/epimerase [Clostridia bacterium]|nr:sugar phosphate isomerase/epimerase [Clostridia bacterium]
MYRIGLSTNGKEINAELFRSYAEAGISSMELSMSAPAWGEANLPQIARWAKEYGVELWSIHLPFGYGAGEPYDISDPSFKTRTVNILSDLINRGAELGIGKFVVHASLEPGEGNVRLERMPHSKESLFKLASVADKWNANVAVEALPRTCLGRTSSEILELISVHPSLRVCFDTNHIQLESDSDFIRRLTDKIITLHVSDFDFVRERHWLPGEGWVNWRAVIGALHEAGYSGVWMYEVAFKAPSSIFRPRDLTPGDFVKNANELFSGSIPTVISTVNPELYK